MAGMSLAFCAPAEQAAEALADLEIVVRELDAVVERLRDAVAGSWALAGDTDWRSPSARAFHAHAEEWARVTVPVGFLADTLREDARRARDAARLVAWSCP